MHYFLRSRIFIRQLIKTLTVYSKAQAIYVGAIYLSANKSKLLKKSFYSKSLQHPLSNPIEKYIADLLYIYLYYHPKIKKTYSKSVAYRTNKLPLLI